MSGAVIERKKVEGLFLPDLFTWTVAHVCNYQQVSRDLDLDLPKTEDILMSWDLPEILASLQSVNNVIQWA